MLIAISWTVGILVIVGVATIISSVASCFHCGD